MEKKIEPCPQCGYVFEGGGYPEDDGSCYSCWSDANETDCCMCQEPELNEHMGEIGSLIAWTGVDDENLPPGLYRVLMLPFYTQSIVGSGWLDKWAIERVGPLPANLDTDGYPAGMLCRECCKKHLAEKEAGK